MHSKKGKQMNKISKNKILGLAVGTAPLAVILSPYRVFAADNATGFWKLPTIGGSDNLMTTINGILNAVIGVVALVAVVMIIIAGIRYATSGGDKAGVETAKNQILYAIIGLVVAFVAYALVAFVTNLLDTNIGVPN